MTKRGYTLLYSNLVLSSSTYSNYWISSHSQPPVCGERNARAKRAQCIITPLKKGKTIQFLSGKVRSYYIDHASNNNNRTIQLLPHIPCIITGTPPAGYWCGTGCRVGGERTAAARGRESRGKSHAHHKEIRRLARRRARFSGFASGETGFSPGFYPE